MQLPAPIKSSATALIGEHCYVSLVEEFDLSNVDCIKYTISKGLGLGIVVGGSIVKIPQILTILSSGSARGLSLMSYVLETLSCIITFSYNVRHGNPFSTYGETAFLTVQDIIITLMILHYARQYGATVGTLIGFSAVIYGLIYMVPPVLMASLYAATIPLSLASKVPQIYTNFVNKSTGQLSVFAVINYFAGTTARVFTTMTELDDPLMLTGSVLASVLNGILAIQVFLYWGNKMTDVKQKKSE
ncbi:mannose-P-dolichol utilization defect 1 protein [Lichtheimia hyalospora FSU 10163]|nr:mannose-P-dolichol utilization defect 1 protein [Lichtheimia hyalospora FSU 10163]